VGIFSKRIAQAYPKGAAPIAVASPWQPTDVLTQFAFNQLFADEVKGSTIPMTRDLALRIPGVKRAHGIHVKQFAGIPFFRMDNQERTPEQPRWLTTSDSGVSPYHRMYGLGSDFFFNGWGCLGFDRDPLDPAADCIHVPYGAWGVDEASGEVWVNTDIVDARYAAYPVVISVGYGENGLLVDGIDTLHEARAIEQAYQDRLNNPTPLTVLGIPREVWEAWTPDERKQYRDQYVQGRKNANGSVVLKVADFPVEFPGTASVDLYESGRNSVRLDIANHTGTPASLLEGVSQGGSGGSQINYTGVANGIGRNELWEFGLAKGFTLAFEARMSLDDICEPGLSIRGDLSNILALPAPLTNPTSQD